MDKLRLVMLYALRFESDRERVHQLLYRLNLEGLDETTIEVVLQVLKYAGQTK